MISISPVPVKRSSPNDPVIGFYSLSAKEFAVMLMAVSVVIILLLVGSN